MLRRSPTSPAMPSSPAATSGSTVLGGPACYGRTSACESSCDRRSRPSTARATAPGSRAARASGIPDGLTLTPGGFHSFEHRWALPEAFSLHQGIGRERVEARIRGLASRLKARLAEVPGVRLRTPQSPGLSAGLVCFEVAGRNPAEVVAHLASRRIVASVTPYALRYVRLGPGIVNTPEHVDAAARAITSLARRP